MSIDYRLPLKDLKNCSRVEIAPSGKVLAVACEAYVDRKGAVADPSASGVVLLDATQTPPTEIKRLLAQDLFQGSIQSSVAFATENVVLVKTQTALGADQDNQLFALDVDTGKTTLLATAARTASGSGYGIAFGGMSCGSSCGDPCLSLRRLARQAAALWRRPRGARAVGRRRDSRRWPTADRHHAILVTSLDGPQTHAKHRAAFARTQAQRAAHP